MTTHQPPLNVGRVQTTALCHRSRGRQNGLTLIELMISITLGMFIVATGLSIFLSSKSTYVSGDSSSRLLDTGRYVLESITRAARQTSYEELAVDDDDQVPIVNDGSLSPNIKGWDAKSLSIATGATLSPTTPTYNGSDILQLRFFGASGSAAAAASRTVLNCAGIPVPGVTTVTQAEEGRGWSIFFVHKPASGEPELRCGYLDANKKLVSLPIATGVESFQVLYGLDTNDDGIPDQFVSATKIKSNAGWQQVVALKVSVLIRGGRVERADVPNTTFNLFGQEYSDPSDKGTRIDESNTADIAAVDRPRSRKLFSTLIQLRNATRGGNIAALP